MTSKANGWLNPTGRPGQYADHVEGTLIGVTLVGNKPSTVEVSLRGTEPVTVPCKQVTSLVNPSQENTRFSINANGKHYTAYHGLKRNSSTEYSISLYAREQLSDSDLDSLFGPPTPSSETEADPPF